MYTSKDLDDLFRTIIKRGMEIDLGGLLHKHNVVDPTAPLPPVKFHLCTEKARPGKGRMTEEDIERMAEFLYEYIRYHKLGVPPAIVGIPSSGEDLARSLQEHARRQGMFVPLLRLSKAREAMRFVGPVSPADKYPFGGPVWLVDDLVHRGLSKLRAITAMQIAGYTVKKILTVLDYDKGAREYFLRLGIEHHTVSFITPVLELGEREKLISTHHLRAIRNYLKTDPPITAAP
jgi:orotate phosphoribosyltransferase